MTLEEKVTITDWILPKYIIVHGHDGIFQLFKSFLETFKKLGNFVQVKKQNVK